MDNFIVSARKYRPATFDTVVGQQSITNTLKNAIRNNQLAQAFLFCGPRGVGKTTCARILAKTINCENPTPGIEPCNTCTSCVTFNESSSFNIHELDAASNNSVDDIRNLVEQVRIPPQMGRYKVYIIDEVHMLSSSAFNAFLKTLEEPPAYAKFILATTEKHKIIPTILSRCQIFDFKRITIHDIASHLEFVAQQEKVNADPEALHIIAQKADGALRDALSILDQMINLGDRNISRELVIENLNVLDYDYYFQITGHMLQGNYKDVLLVLNDIILKGFEGQHFITGLGEHLRNLLMCHDSSTVRLIEASDAIREKYLSQARSAPILFLVNALDINNKCDISYRAASNKRLTIEIALIQMCQSGSQLNSSIPLSKTDPVVQQPAPTLPAIQAATPSPATKPIVAESVTESPKVVPPVPAPSPEPMAATAKPAEIKPLQPVKEEPLNKFPSASMHSIKDILNQGAEVDPKIRIANQAEERKSPFTLQQLVAAFRKYAATVQDESSMLYTALTTYDPALKESNLIQITVDNSILEKEVNDSWITLSSFLKNELQNDLLKMEIIINTQPVGHKRFLSDKDKLDAMKEKNPELRTLTDQLNLELDV